MRRGALAALVLLLLGPGAQAQHLLNDDEPAEDLGDQLLEVLLVQQLRYHERVGVQSLALSPDGREVAAVTRVSKQGPKAWKLPDGKPVNLPPMSVDVEALAYDPQMQWVAAALHGDPLSDRKGGIQLYDLADGKPGAILPGSSGATSMAFSPDGTVLAAATGDGVVAWKARRPEQPVRLDDSRAPMAVTWLAGDRLGIVAERGTTFAIAEVPEGRRVDSWSIDSYDAACQSPDGRFAAVSARSGGWEILDLYSGQSQKVPGETRVVSLAWAATGTIVAAGTDDGRVLIFEVAGAQPVARGATPWGKTAVDAPTRDERGDGSAREYSRADASSGEPGDLGDSRESGYSRGSAAARDEGTDRDDRESGDRLDALSERSSGDTGLDRMGRRESGGAEADRPDIAVRYSAEVLDRFGSDPRTAGQLERALRDSERKMQSCWRKARRKGEPTLGTIRLPVSISANGEGRGFGPEEDGVGNETLVECLQDKLKADLFPAGLGNLEAVLVFEFYEAP